MPFNILVINPNSSQLITDGIAEAIGSLPPALSFSFSSFTCPPDGPPSIDDQVTSVLSAAESYRALLPQLSKYDGFLVCCFSDHPLVPMLRESTTKPVIGIFEAAIVHALLLGKKFGIVTSGPGWVVGITAGVRNFLGANASDRFVGVSATGLGVLELKEGCRKKVQSKVIESGVNVAKLGADVIILGCAGMTGMELDIIEGIDGSGLGRVKVVDGVQAGVRLLVGLCE